MTISVISTVQRASVNIPSNGTATLAYTVANAGSLIVVNTVCKPGTTNGDLVVSDESGTFLSARSDGDWGADTGVASAYQHSKENHPAGNYTITIDPVGFGALDAEFWVTEITGVSTAAGYRDGNPSGATSSDTLNATATTVSRTSGIGNPAQHKNIVIVCALHSVAETRDWHTPTVSGVAATELAEQQIGSSTRAAAYVFYRIIDSKSAVTIGYTVAAGALTGVLRAMVGVYKDVDTSAPPTIKAGGATSIQRSSGVKEYTPGSVTYTKVGESSSTWVGSGVKLKIPQIFLIAGSGAESQRTGTTNPHTWTHTPAQTAQGIVVTVVHGGTSTDHVTGITYGGVPMTRVVTAAHTTGEPGRSDIWFLGTGIPPGAQTISVQLATATADDIHFVSNSLHSDTGDDIEAIDSDSQVGIIANPSRTLQYGGKYALAIGAFYGGANTPAFTPSAGCIQSVLWDMGNFYSVIFRQSIGDTTADFTIGGTVASDDVAMAVAAFAKAAPSYQRTGFGVRIGIGSGEKTLVFSEIGLAAKIGVGSGNRERVANRTGIGISP